MRAAKRNAIAICTATALSAVIYLVPPPGPRYYPLENIWRMETIADAPSMGWYWHAAVALFTGVFVAAMIWLYLRQRPTAALDSVRTQHTIALLTALLWFGVAALLTWREIASSS